MIKIGTHSHIYHLDELVATALVKFTDDVEIIRSRCPLVLGEAEMLIDVGGEYNPLKSLYDHHQFEKNDVNYGLSSAGLVWKDMKDFFYSQYDDLTDLENFIKHVDARDTRVNYDPSNVYDVIGEAIVATNCINPGDKEQDYRFNIMLDIIEEIIEALASKNVKLYTQRIVNLEKLADSYTIEKRFTFNKRQIFKQEVGKVIVSEFFPEWRKISRELSKCFVMPGDKEGQYKIMTDTSKYHIVVTKDEVFTHANGFISVVQPKEKSKELGIALSDGELFEVSIEEIEKAFLHICTLLGKDL